jgi:hypothetical protein
MHFVSEQYTVPKKNVNQRRFSHNLKLNIGITFLAQYFHRYLWRICCI